MRMLEAQWSQALILVCEVTLRSQNMISSVTNFNCLAQHLLVKHNIVTPTLNANSTSSIIPSNFFIFLRAGGGMTGLRCCNYCHLSSDFSSEFQSSMTTFSSQFADKQGMGSSQWTDSSIIHDTIRSP